ncbi:MAG: PadR family transcriptional regulator [Vicinamibacteria bacterium]
MYHPNGLKAQTFQILLALADRDRHGLEIMRDVLERTQGQMHLWPGMLYGSLKELVNSELVVEKKAPRDGKAGGGRPRYYGITEEGRKACAAEAERLESYVQAARARNVLKPVNPR